MHSFTNRRAAPLLLSHSMLIFQSNGTDSTKIIESGSMWGQMMSDYAFRHALRYRAETWHGGRGRAHEVCGHIFEATPPGVKGLAGVNLP